LATIRDLPRRWDIFCVAIDNYGDVGVAWRLARQLAAEHGIAVRLFVDALVRLAHMAPQVDPSREEQVVCDVDVRRWGGPQRDLPPAAISSMGEVAIEAFGCGLPDAYLAGMGKRRAQPLWINLEYLSAEEWIEGCHRLASRQPRLPLTRHFFFPGFTPATGGLLRERDLFAQRDGVRADSKAQSALWRILKIETPAPEALKVSFFCYPHAPIGTLLDAWADGNHAVICIVPEGAASAAIGAWASSAPTTPGGALRRGRLTIAPVPFLAQDDYDKLLWACDLNFVRGEDSLVRGQWAARPLVWHCYPQADAAHLIKLDAFLARYTRGLAPAASATYVEIAHAWNGGHAALAWEALARCLPALRAHAEAWAGELGTQPDLASNLVKFASDLV
jgi:uncharacterized repeat protein (TIGR03837 family)